MTATDPHKLMLELCALRSALGEPVKAYAIPEKRFNILWVLLQQQLKQSPEAAHYNHPCWHQIGNSRVCGFKFYGITILKLEDVRHVSAAQEGA